MSTPRPFTANSNKLAYAQAFSRTSTPVSSQRMTVTARPERRHRITLRRHPKTTV